MHGIQIIRPYGARSPAFVPTDICGCQLWLKADAGTYQDAAFTTPASIDTDPVGGWQDQSGNGNHMTQTIDNAYRPLLKLNIQNGLPAARFDGVNDYLQAASNAVLDFTTESLSGFAVCHGATTKTDYLFSKRRTSGYRFTTSYSAPNDRLRFQAADAVDVGSCVYATTVTAMMLAEFVFAHGGNAALYKNGGSLGAPVSFATVDIYSSSDTFTVGANSDAPISVNNLSGDIAEIIIYNSALSDANRIRVETYLNSRYAIW